MSYKVNKQKCLGVKNCGICIQTCPGATREGKDGKAKVVDQKKLEECGGERVCPMRAIERIDGEERILSSYQ
jgi:ferredoxin